MKRTLRTSTALAAVLAIFLQVNTVAVFSLLYSLNQQSIASTVCERKTESCHGQCFLKKQLQASQEEGSGKNATQNEKSLRSTQLSVEYLISELAIKSRSCSIETSHFENSELITSGVTQSVFNPPRA